MSLTGKKEKKIPTFLVEVLKYDEYSSLFHYDNEICRSLIPLNDWYSNKHCRIVYFHYSKSNACQKFVELGYEGKLMTWQLAEVAGEGVYLSKMELFY